MTILKSGDTVGPGDKIGRPAKGSSLWWLVVGGDDKRLAIAYVSPSHRTSISYGKTYVIAPYNIDPAIRRLGEKADE